MSFCSGCFVVGVVVVCGCGGECVGVLGERTQARTQGGAHKHINALDWPILVVFRQKLWPQSHFGSGRRYPISPFLDNFPQ